MSRWPPLILLAVTLAVGWAIADSIDSLPEPVASSFGFGGVAQAWMSRATYAVWVSGLSVGVPWFVFAAIALLPRAWPRLVNLPHRDYWLAPPRREASLAFLAVHACALGCLMALFAYGIHTLLMMANAVAPPRLPTAPFLTLLGAFLVCTGLWMLLLYRRFGRPPGTL